MAMRFPLLAGLLLACLSALPLAAAVGPTTTITAPGDPQAAPWSYAITFSADVGSTFTAGDMLLTNAMAGTLSGSGASYSLPITPRSTIRTVFTVPAGTALISLRSSAGNTPLTRGMPLRINGQTVYVADDVTVLATTTPVSLAQPLAADAPAGSDLWLPEGVTVKAKILAGAANAAGTPSQASSEESVIYDPSPPVAVVTAPTAFTSVQTYTITFSEPVTGLLTSALTVTGGSAGALSASNGNKTWTTPVTVTAGAGATSLRVNANAAFDQAGNYCAASNTGSLAKVAVADVTASPHDAAAGPATAVTITVALNRTTAFVRAADQHPTLLLETGTTNRLATCTTTGGNVSQLVFTYTPTIGDAATVLDYVADTSLDLDGATLDSLTSLALPAPGSAHALAQSHLAVRTSAVATTIGGSTPSAVNPLLYTVTFSPSIDDSAPPATGDFLVTGGTIASIAVAPGGASAQVLVTATTAGPVKLRLEAGAVSDGIGNPNSRSNEKTVTFDPAAPTLLITAPASPRNTAPLTFSIAASKPVTGLAADDLVVANGTAILTGGSTAFTASVAPKANLQLNAAAATDDTTISLCLTPGVAGSVTLGAHEALLVGTNLVTINTSGTTTITATPVNVPLDGALLTGAAIDAAVWRAQGIAVTVDAPAGVCTDDAGAANADPLPASTVYDPTPPLFRIGDPVADGSAVKFILTASEPVRDLGLSDLTVVGGTANSIVGSAGTAPYFTTWTAQVTPAIGVGSLTFAVKADSAFDAAGNASKASATVPWTVVPRVRTVAAQNPNGTYEAGIRLRIRVTFSEAVTVTGVPVLKLAMDGGARSATYSGGTGTTILLFDYTIAAGDVASDLDYTATNALELSDGTLQDAEGHAAALTLPAPGASGSLGASSDLVIAAGEPTGPAKPDVGEFPDDSSDGCGAGSGIALLLSLGWLTTAFRRRHRR